MAGSKWKGCDAVREHTTMPIPDKLWHYTSFAAFEGILISKKIWATDYRFLNDREEFTHCKTLAFELASQEPEFIEDNLPARQFLTDAMKIAFSIGILHESRITLMVASFSEHGDQLSQWRGYAGNSTGVSIGLDLRGLRPPAHVETQVVFAPCVYKDEEKRRLLRAMFADYYANLISYWNPIVNEAKAQTALTRKGVQQLLQSHQAELARILGRSQVNLVGDLLRIGPLMKDSSFHEEREWRLVLPMEMIHMPSAHKYKFRSVRDALVPYIAYPLLPENQDGPIACTGLIMGPGSHPNAEIGVNLLLNSQFIPTRARQSNVPYRPSH